jgi:ATP-dependent DNA helicase RecG
LGGFKLNTISQSERATRNRRVGEFLKELEMTEGRGTGIPKILREIRKNKSPKPIFHTDEDRTFFMVEFPIHPGFAKNLKATMEVTPEVTPEVKHLLDAITGEHSRRELQEILGLKDSEHFRKAYLLPAINAGYIEMTLMEKPKSRFQKYRLTEKGKILHQERLALL